jgi:hypothetical protein
LEPIDVIGLERTAYSTDGVVERRIWTKSDADRDALSPAKGPKTDLAIDRAMLIIALLEIRRGELRYAEPRAAMHRPSESIGATAAALAKAQGELTNPENR